MTTSQMTTTAIDTITLEASDPTAAHDFYRDAFGIDSLVRVVASDAPTAGFRGYTMSLIVSQPTDVNALVDSAGDAGATVLKPAAKSFWGYGGAVQAPDGAVWTIASSAKKDSGPATGKIDDITLLLGVADVKASKRFYVDRGFAVKRSFGGKYVEFDTPDAPIKFGLNPRHLLAKNAGSAPEGSGSHRITIAGDDGEFTDPDGFSWTSA
ncbi:MAG: glyoxalase [Actinomycetia bacterium]|nr:glyoxalase [Actinomycetes bacterium]